MDFSTYIKFGSDLTENQETTITYSGYLFKKNSSSLKIVYGFGDNWMYTKEQKMEKTENGFVANIKMLNFEKFNFCFKSPNNEWDNNYGKNFTAPISKFKVEEAFVLNENVIDDILTNLVEYDVSKVEKPVSATTYEVKEVVETPEVAEPVNAVQEIEVVPEVAEPVNTVQEIEVTSEVDVLVENFQNRIKVENYENIYMDEPAKVVDSVVDDIVNDLANNSVQNIVIEEPVVTSSVESVETIIAESNPEHVVEELETVADTPVVENVENIIEESVDTPVDAIVNDMIDDLYASSQHIESDDVPFEETGLIVSPRALGKFYYFKKKMKLAVYKFFHGLPKILSGNLNEDNN